MYNASIQYFTYKTHEYALIYEYANKLICISLTIYLEAEGRINLDPVSSLFHQNWPSYR